MTRGEMANGSGINRTGYFGKIPTQGDFVERNLPRPLVDALDDWTRHSMRESQRALGRGWLDAFLIAPVWRGAVSADILSHTTMALVMMPSVDRVGRYFPLILVTPLPGHRGPLSGLPRQIEGWYNKAEALALSTLSEAFRRDTFDAAVDALVPPGWYEPNLRRLPTDDARSIWWTPGGDGSVMGFDDLPDPEDYHHHFLSAAASPHSEPSHDAPEEGEDLPGPLVPEAASVRPARVLVTIEAGASTLKGTRSAVLTDATALGEDLQALSLISGIGMNAGLRSAVDTVRETLGAISGPFSMNDLIAEAKGKLGRANAILCARALHGEHNFAASCATLLVQGNRYAVIWCGNVRCYLLRNGQLRLLTRDHTDPVLTQVVTRAVGASRQLSLETDSGEARPGDRYLLCSTGLSSVTPEHEIHHALESAASARQAADHLTQDAIIAGAPLDVSALVVILSARSSNNEPTGAGTNEVEV
ncbi:type VI secretion system-associated protein TagF [uncultured Roseobacter sp.]|uniref:type VI secretion system-associated protein TagF n=1 Tax=uncultured Roseobacter sp. TaxID=114847 RepID=UPI002629F0AD|nr:type VI secretion system-associated protein TagF [uncultured Roseobacter sp.]